MSSKAAFLLEYAIERDCERDENRQTYGAIQKHRRWLLVLKDDFVGHLYDAFSFASERRHREQREKCKKYEEKHSEKRI